MRLTLNLYEHQQLFSLSPSAGTPMVFLRSCSRSIQCDIESDHFTHSKSSCLLPLLLSPFLSQLVVPAAAFITLFQDMILRQCSRSIQCDIESNTFTQQLKLPTPLSGFLSQLVVPAAGFYEPIPMQFQSLPSAYTTHIATGAAAVTENPLGKRDYSLSLNQFRPSLPTLQIGRETKQFILSPPRLICK